jgi:hypothetical protein
LEDWGREIMALKPLPNRPVPGAKYNLACAYSLAIEYAMTDKKEEYFQKAMAALESAFDDKYFGPIRYAELKKDSDFKAINMRPEFIAFVAKVESTIKQMPKKAIEKSRND